MRPVYALLLTGLMILSVGCVQRRITITSEPAGALVHLNDQEIGRTPVTVPFTFYGVYDVRLEKDGYAPLWTEQKAKMPPWDAPIIDLAFEMVPDGEVHLEWHYVLEEKGDVDEAALIERAEQLREINAEPTATD